DLVGVQALGLEENMMLVLVGEAHDLVLNARAVARTGRLDLAGIHRGAVKVGADDLVNGFVGRTEITRQLRQRWMPILGVFVQIRKWRRRFVAGLNLEPREIDRLAIKARRSAGFETAQLQPEPFQTPGEPTSGGLTHAS